MVNHACKVAVGVDDGWLKKLTIVVVVVAALKVNVRKQLNLVPLSSQVPNGSAMAL